MNKRKQKKQRKEEEKERKKKPLIDKIKDSEQPPWFLDKNYQALSVEEISVLHKKVCSDTGELFDIQKQDIVKKLILNHAFIVSNNDDEEMKNQLLKFDQESNVNVIYFNQIASLLHYMFFSDDSKEIELYGIAFEILEEEVTRQYELAILENQKELFFKDLHKSFEFLFSIARWDLSSIDINKLILITRLFFCEYKAGNPGNLLRIKFNQQDSIWFNLSLQLINMFYQHNATNESNQPYLDFLFDYIMPFTAITSHQKPYCRSLQGVKYTNDISNNQKEIEELLKKGIANPTKDQIRSEINRLIKSKILDSFTQYITTILRSDIYENNDYIEKKFQQIRIDLDIIDFYIDIGRDEDNNHVVKLDAVNNKILKWIITNQKRMKRSIDFYRQKTIKSCADLFFVEYQDIPKIIGETIKWYALDYSNSLDSFIQNTDDLLKLLPAHQAHEALGFALYYLVRNIDLYFIELFKNKENLDDFERTKLILRSLFDRYKAPMYHCFDKIDLKNWLFLEEIEKDSTSSILSNVLGTNLKWEAGRRNNKQLLTENQIEQLKRNITDLKTILTEASKNICNSPIILLKNIFSIYDKKILGVDYTKSYVCSNLSYFNILEGISMSLSGIKKNIDEESEIANLIDGFLIESSMYDSFYQEARKDFYEKVNIKNEETESSFRYNQIKNFILYYCEGITFKKTTDENPENKITIDKIKDGNKELNLIDFSNKKNKEKINYIEKILKNAFDSSNISETQKVFLYSFCFFSPITTCAALRLNYQFIEQGSQDENNHLVDRMKAVNHWYENGDSENFNNASSMNF